MRDKRITKQQRQAIKSARRSAFSGVRLTDSTGAKYRPVELDHNLRATMALTRTSQAH